MKNRLCIAAAVALIITSSASPAVLNADEEYTPDEKIISVLNDENGDGIKDLADLRLSESLNLKLDNFDEISFLKYADRCEKLYLSGGNIKDFSVLREMKRLRSVYLSGIRPESFSFLENDKIMVFDYSGTDITHEDIADFLRAEDYVIPAGHMAQIGIFPIIRENGMKLVIGSPEIAAFGEYGEYAEMDAYLSHGIIRALKPGETDYSLVFGDKVIKTGKITVVPSEPADAPLESGIVKTLKISGEYYNEERQTVIYNSDGSLWIYNGNEYKKIAENVKEYSSGYTSYGNPFFILHNDCTMTINGVQVFDKNTKVTSMNANYYDAFVTTENNELWHVECVNGVTKKFRVTDDCAAFYPDEKIFVNSDGEVFYVKLTTISGRVASWKNYSLGSIDIKTIVKANYRKICILDNGGKLIQVDIPDIGAPEVSTLKTGVNELGRLKIKNSSEGGLIGLVYNNVPSFRYGGKVYRITVSGYEAVDGECDIISDEEYRKEFDALSGSDSKVKFIPFNMYVSVPSKFEDCFIDSDYNAVCSIRDEDKTEYISFAGFYGSVTNSEFSYGTETDGDDYIVLVVRTDGSLWEYHIADSKFVRKDFGKHAAEEPSPAVTDVTPAVTEPKSPVEGTMIVTGPPEVTNPVVTGEVYTASSADLYSLVLYMQGKTDEVPKRADWNNDGKVNVADIVSLKSRIAGNFIYGSFPGR